MFTNTRRIFAPFIAIALLSTGCLSDTIDPIDGDEIAQTTDDLRFKQGNNVVDPVDCPQFKGNNVIDPSDCPEFKGNDVVDPADCPQFKGNDIIDPNDCPE